MPAQASFTKWRYWKSQLVAQMVLYRVHLIKTNPTTLIRSILIMFCLCVNLYSLLVFFLYSLLILEDVVCGYVRPSRLHQRLWNNIPFFLTLHICPHMVALRCAFCTLTAAQCKFWMHFICSRSKQTKLRLSSVLRCEKIIHISLKSWKVDIVIKIWNNNLDIYFYYNSWLTIVLGQTKSSCKKRTLSQTYHSL